MLVAAMVASGDNDKFELTAVGVLVLRALPELALGLAAVFLVAVVVVAFLAGRPALLVVVFLGAAFLAGAALAAVFY